MTPYYYRLDDGLFLDCLMDTEGAEAATDVCPGQPVDAWVVSAKLDGYDFIDLLREDVLDDISKAFLKEAQSIIESDYETMLKDYSL